MGIRRGNILTRRSKILPLALWRRVIFVDWHGVLSTAPFWHSILANEKHPYYRVLRQKVVELFSQTDVVNSWMRGNIDTEGIIQLLNLSFGRSAREDFLRRRLVRDCQTMPIAGHLVQTLQQLRQTAAIVIATDNMDCMVAAAELRRDLGFADEILSSSDLGVLKAEDPMRFFGPWLSERKLTFADAILIDDSRENCAAFRSHGGTAIFIEDPDQASDALLSIWNNLESK